MSAKDEILHESIKILKQEKANTENQLQQELSLNRGQAKQNEEELRNKLSL